MYSFIIEKGELVLKLVLMILKKEKMQMYTNERDPTK
jgi:hypothetical protein